MLKGIPLLSAPGPIDPSGTRAREPGSARFRLPPDLWGLRCPAIGVAISGLSCPSRRSGPVADALSAQLPTGPPVCAPLHLCLMSLGASVVRRRPRPVQRGGGGQASRPPCFSVRRTNFSAREKITAAQTFFPRRSQGFILQNPAALFHHVEVVHVQILQRVHRAGGPANLHQVHLLWPQPSPK